MKIKDITEARRQSSPGMVSYGASGIPKVHIPPHPAGIRKAGQHNQLKKQLEALPTTKEKYEYAVKLAKKNPKTFGVSFYNDPEVHSKRFDVERRLKSFSYNNETGEIKLTPITLKRTDYIYSYNIEDFNYYGVIRYGKKKVFNFYPKIEIEPNESIEGDWMNKSKENKFVVKDQQQEYLDKGWKMGYIRAPIPKKYPPSYFAKKDKKDAKLMNKFLTGKMGKPKVKEGMENVEKLISKNKEFYETVYKDALKFFNPNTAKKYYNFLQIVKNREPEVEDFVELMTDEEKNKFYDNVRARHRADDEVEMYDYCKFLVDVHNMQDKHINRLSHNDDDTLVIVFTAIERACQSIMALNDIQVPSNKRLN